MATIPLPELGIKPPEQQNPLEQYGRMMQMRMMGQEYQQRQQEMQIKGQQIKDQQAITKAWQGYDPKKDSPEDLIQGVIKAGGSGAAANQMQQTMMARKQQLMALDKDQFELENKKNDRMLGRLNAAENVDDKDLVGHVQGAIQESIQAGDLDPQHAQQLSQLLQSGNPKQIRSALDSAKKGYQMESTQFEQANKEMTARGTQLRGEAAMEQANTAQERLKAEMPGGPLEKGKVTEAEKYTQSREDARQRFAQAQENARSQRTISAENARQEKTIEAESQRQERGQQLKEQAKQTTDEQKRSDLAQNLNENLDSLEEIANRRPELFGPYNGRVTKFKMAAGSNDPDIGKLKTIEHQIGMVQQSTHGMRSALGVQSAADSVVNNFHNSPEALKGSIKAARDSAKTFLGNANPGQAKSKGAPPVGTISRGYKFKGGDPSKQESWEKQ